MFRAEPRLGPGTSSTHPHCASSRVGLLSGLSPAPLAGMSLLQLVKAGAACSGGAAASCCAAPGVPQGRGGGGCTSRAPRRLLARSAAAGTGRHWWVCALQTLGARLRARLRLPTVSCSHMWCYTCHQSSSQAVCLQYACMVRSLTHRMVSGDACRGHQVADAPGSAVAHQPACGCIGEWAFTLLHG